MHHRCLGAQRGQAQNQLQPILLPECIGRTIEQVSYDRSENPNSLHVKMRCIHAEEIIQPADHVAQVCSLLVFYCYNIRPMFNTCIYRVNVTLCKSCRPYMHRTVTVSQKRSSILEHIRDLIIGWDYVATFFSDATDNMIGSSVGE